MGRTAGRSASDTRRVVLDAASEVFRTRGMAATLDDVAQEAGLSKGGVIYHFTTKDELVQALAAALLADFRESVHECLDPADERPGRLTRAYVRASLADVDPRAAREAYALIAQLITSPAVAEVAREDAARWNEELGHDGLPQTITSLVIAAADGASVAPLWGAEPSAEQSRDLADQLISLTLDPQAWAQTITP